MRDYACGNLRVCYEEVNLARIFHDGFRHAVSAPSETARGAVERGWVSHRPENEFAVVFVGRLGQAPAKRVIIPWRLTQSP